MRRNSSSTHLALIAFFASLPLIAHADGFKPVSAEIDENFREAVTHCIAPSYRDIVCYYDESDTPLKPNSAPQEYFTDPLVFDGLFPVVRGVKEAVWATTLLAQPNQKRYWQERDAGANFDALTELAVNKAKNEELKDCQKACLASCISSRIIRYNRQVSKALDSGSIKVALPELRRFIETSYGAVENGIGVCREFATIDRSLMWNLGLKATLAGGDHMSVGADGSYKVDGAHQMVHVSLDGQTYLMEPQSSSCHFSSPRFSLRQRPSKPAVLEGTDQPQRPDAHARVSTNWTKWLDVVGLAESTFHKAQDAIVPAR